MCDCPCAIIAHYRIPRGPCACKLCIAHFLWSTVPVWVKCVIVPLLVLPIVGARSTSNTWWALLVIVLNVHSRKWNRRKIVDNGKLDLIYLGAWIPMTFNPMITFPLSDHHTTTDTTSDHQSAWVKIKTSKQHWRMLPFQLLTGDCFHGTVALIKWVGPLKLFLEFPCPDHICLGQGNTSTGRL